MKKIFLFTLVCFTTLVSQAQESSLLWKVSGKGLKQPSWLYGTYHLLCKEEIKISPAAQQAFDKASTLYLEMNMADPQFAAKMQALLAPKPENDLRKAMSDSDFQVFSNYIRDSFHMEATQLIHLKPLVLISLLMVQHMRCPPTGLEQEFLGMAKASNKPVEGLESLETQLKIFDVIPDSVQMADIIKDIKNPEAARKRDEQTKQYYAEGNVDKIFEFALQESSYAEYANVLLYTRNKNWIPVIEKAATTSSTFFAFGAGHLGGEEGVINLLRKQGYTVEPVK
ncbi:MAG: TraB/GumN family protein [Chitinophaga sp.]|uniref:TraB/GumN family protein n=1 Tax=Chitinophaga sp. TaxID=1869181 RepID=UPI0025BE4AEE|nr:TraB/GumN family protein [Chitinophaga sp.]MBV8253458.1 TraB/GumN family protein [Chitinophaga sp.]